ncbi:ThiF family adenylyltransferase [Amphritea atlantica]|uniref:ThiF family adenylyltransferase n=1 Tax=Amphritea atlantica TaxID=355243 RepID=A0ABY5GST6_9GAMM|nr:ThiF family adenylyltransferase [Amphritea atlantica]
MTWYIDNPSVFEDEIESLNQHAFDYEIDEPMKSQGRLIILVKYVAEGEVLNLRCEYPPNYPYFSVKVSCENFPPGRHLHPVDKGLCLFADEQSKWHPSDKLATTIAQQIPKILEIHNNPTTMSDEEIDEGYQISGQMIYEPNSVIFVEDVELPCDEISGLATLGVNQSIKPSQTIPAIRGLLSLDKSPKKANEAQSGHSIEKFFPKKLSIRWLNLEKTPSVATADELLEFAVSKLPALKTPNYGSHGVDIIALAFPEETSRDKVETNWAFIVRRRIKKTKKKYELLTSLVRADFYTKNNLNSRVPRLNGIDGKSVLLIGVGAIGSQVALQLARAGIKKLTVIDCDILQAGNLSRWVPAFEFIGFHKAEAIRKLIFRAFPYVECHPVNMKIGVTPYVNTSEHEKIDSHDFLVDMIKDADIVVDCAAETNVSLYLSEVCARLNKSYMWATATDGAWGGIVGKQSSENKRDVWKKFSYKIHANEIKSPPGEKNAEVQPKGCFSPTFTGTGFDLDNISLMASRVCISMLLADESNAYPEFEWDVAVLNLWDEKTNLPLAPNWITYNI